MQVVYLVKNGVSEERAWDMDSTMREAWYIALAQMDGNEFDFKSGKFLRKKEG